MACSKEFSRILLFLKTSSNIQPFWFALLVDHGCAFCNQLAHIWARTAALLSHPSFCLNCKSDVFLLHVVHISWYSFNRKIQCLCLMKLHVSDLGNGCPVAASPAITTLTTEQPSKSHDLSWAFQVTTALPKSCKMQKSWCYLRSSWATFGAGAQLRLTVSVCTLFIIQSLWRKALARRKVKSQLCPEMNAWTQSSILCCLWGYCLAWLITKFCAWAFLSDMSLYLHTFSVLVECNIYLTEVCH